MSDDSPSSIAEVALRVAERFGLPVVLLAVVLWLIRDAAISLHGTVMVPVVKSHTEFLQATQETLNEIGMSQMQQARTMQEIAAGQREIQQAVTKRTGQQGGE
jgi:hypothetical protein